MDIRTHVVALNERRLRINHEMQSFIDDCVKRHPGETFSEEEKSKLDKMTADIDEIDAEVRSFVERETREREHAELREAQHRVFGENRTERKEQTEEQEFRAWLRGEPETVSRHVYVDESGSTKRGFTIRAEDIARAAREREMLRQGASADEIRTLLWDTGSMASAVPTTMARDLWRIMEAQVSMFRAPTTRFNTAGGGNMDFPKEASVGAGTQVIAQGTAIGGTDPGFDKITLGAFKYGQLAAVASEVIQDAVFPVVPYVTSRVGTNVARLIDADLVVGTGSGEPLGIMASGGTGIGGTVATGGTLIDPTYEKLIDLVYSVNDGYRSSGNAGWLLRDSTAGTLRKLRAGNGGTEGEPLWTPSLTAGIPGQGQPDQLLGFPVFIDANVASLASNARIVGFGDFSAYYIRTVGDFVFERSDDYGFNTDLVYFRGKWRVDGDLIDNLAWNILKRSV
jgi:HK97 family phage major capsid protein